jgi:adenine-specific DNA-methyltransferase
LNILFGEKCFDTPKPVELIFRMLTLCANKTDIVLDFFSGSATTAEAVMKYNLDKNYNIKYILVQLPELCNEKSEAFINGYKNICEIGKKRIDKSGEQIKEEYKDKEGIDKLDIGFKVLKLDSSNLKKWNPDYKNIERSLFDSVENYVKVEQNLMFFMKL